MGGGGGPYCIIKGRVKTKIILKEVSPTLVHSTASMAIKWPRGGGQCIMYTGNCSKLNTKYSFWVGSFSSPCEFLTVLTKLQKFDNQITVTGQPVALHTLDLWTKYYPTAELSLHFYHVTLIKLPHRVSPVTCGNSKFQKAPSHWW